MFFMRRSEILLAKIRGHEEMTRREMFNLIVDLSIPSILAQITTVLMFFIDAAMVGHLGTRASAAIGLIESSTWLCGSISTAVSMGFSVQVAHFIGSNDFAKARLVFRHGIFSALLFSTILGLIGISISWHLPYWLGGDASIAGDASWYFLIFMLAMPFFQMQSFAGNMLKCSGNMRVPSIVSIMVCVLDVVFNYIFIYQLGLGVKGAAIGTALAVCTGMAIQMWFAVSRSNMLSLVARREPFRWVPSFIRNAIGISAPMALQSILMGVAQIVSITIVAPLGVVAIAANTFAITVESLCYMPGYGIGEAATTLVGQSIGAGRKVLCRSFAAMTISLAMGVMAVMGIVMYIFAPEMMGLLTPVGAIRDCGAEALRIEAFAEPLFAASIVGYSICVGAGDTKVPAIMNLLSMWGVRLSLAAMLAPAYGLNGVWFAMACELVFRGLIFLWRVFASKKLR